MIEFGFCDAIKNLHDKYNDDTWRVTLDLLPPQTDSSDTDNRSSTEEKEEKQAAEPHEILLVPQQIKVQCFDSDNHSGHNETVHQSMNNKCQLYVISYLVSETRGQWEGFFTNLVDAVDSGTMFYFAEPVPWQLHRLCDLFRNSLDFLWIDSSMYHTALQCLERRVGPAILFAIKK